MKSTTKESTAKKVVVKVAENLQPSNVVQVDLQQISTSDYNPRKHFDENALTELAGSIQHLGVLQPIMLRPLSEDAYEVVFGERRFLASKLAGLETIPAIIHSITTEQAEIMAITENLQRADVTPMEEAIAYKRLIETKKYDVTTLVTTFGKSESYIRIRLRLNTLIPEVLDMVNNDDIPIGFAYELCRYESEVQKKVCSTHLKDNYYNSWRTLRVKEFADRLFSNYTNKLDRYVFDKTECAACSDNTNTQVLFADCGDCASCLNTTCMRAKIVQYLVAKCVEMTQNDPRINLAVQHCNTNADVLLQLAEMGYAIENVANTYNLTSEPRMPKEPAPKEYNSEADYVKALECFAEQTQKYRDSTTNIEWSLSEGALKKYLFIEENMLIIRYEPVKADVAENAKGQQIRDVIAKDEQSRREMAVNIYRDTNKLITDNALPATAISDWEDKIIYFEMLDNLRESHYPMFGVEDNDLSDEVKFEIIENLTDEKRTVIKRDYLIERLCNSYCQSAEADLLSEFAKLHYPDQYAAIVENHRSLYDKSHAKFEEKLTALGYVNEALVEEMNSIKIIEEPIEIPEPVEQEDQPYIDDEPTPINQPMIEIEPFVEQPAHEKPLPIEELPEYIAQEDIFCESLNLQDQSKKRRRSKHAA